MEAPNSEAKLSECAWHMRALFAPKYVKLAVHFLSHKGIIKGGETPVAAAEGGQYKDGRSVERPPLKREQDARGDDPGKQTETAQFTP